MSPASQVTSNFQAMSGTTEKTPTARSEMKGCYYRLLSSSLSVLCLKSGKIRTGVFIYTFRPIKDQFLHWASASLFSNRTLFDYFIHRQTERGHKLSHGKYRENLIPAAARWRIKKSILDFLVLDKTSDIMTIMLPIKIKERRIDRNTICSVLEKKSEIIKTIDTKC